MLVYANQMTFSGEGAEEAVSKSVGGWLKEKLGFGLHPNQLKTPGEYKGQLRDSPSYLKIYTATEQIPKLYSWVLMDPDKDVSGRQWNTELVLKVSGDTIEFSCVLKTDERSALVATPVMASKPRVVSYVIENIRNSKNTCFNEQFIGKAVKGIGEDEDSYHSFLFEIERTERRYPLVLISPNIEGEYLINSAHLQDELAGLAQVVKVVPEFDSYKMKEILGKQWSAWNGSVNVIHIPKSTRRVRGKYFLAEEIEGWGDTQHARISRLLAWVTNDTNIAQRRNRIRPEDVIRAGLRNRIEAAHKRVHEMEVGELRTELLDVHNRITDQDVYFNQLAEENGQLEAHVLESQEQLKEANDEIGEKNYKISSLQDQLENSGNQTPSHYNSEWLLELACRKDPPNPEDCLDSIERVFGGDCIVLGTAKKSARNANTFKNGRQLLDMLRKLMTKYRQALIKGGDNQARLVFGKNEYAAKESETVMKNKSMKRSRTFKYREKDVEMFRHLKIGSADDVTRTIRVYFHWDSDRKKIVIGYCGEHLPVSDR